MITRCNCIRDVHLLFALHTYDRDLDNGAIKYDDFKKMQSRRFVLSYQKIKHESTTREKGSREFLLHEKRKHGISTARKKKSWIFVRTKKEYLIFPLHEK